MNKKAHGFTIVELLIVIVVIAVLATIAIVAYTGIQQRARTTQTISAVAAYTKALSMYKSQQGDYPNMASCLGTTYGRGSSGTDVSGPQCRQDTAGGGGVDVNAAFATALAPYMQSQPQPDTSVTAISTGGYPWYRGAYYYNTTPRRVDFIFPGTVTCPSIGGLTFLASSTFNGGTATRCLMTLPD